MTTDTWTQLFIAIVGPMVVAIAGGIAVWLRKSYQKFEEMVEAQQATNVLLSEALSRIDKHEERLNEHDAVIGKIWNAGLDSESSVSP